MKKVFMKYIKLLLLCLLLTSCTNQHIQIQPIEKYRNKGIIVLEEPPLLHNFPIIHVKNKDSVFKIQIPHYDAKDLKPGDTL